MKRSRKNSRRSGYEPVAYPAIAANDARTGRVMSSYVNMSNGPVTCIVHTDAAMPADAYAVIGKLAQAVADAAVELDALLPEVDVS